MKRLLASFGWLLLLIPFISVAGTKTILNTIDKAVDSEERQVSDFTGISSSGAYDVYVEIGTTESLRIEGEEDLIKNIETKIDKGILKIRNSKSTTGWSWSGREKVRIYITAKSLNNLTISGSGNLTVNDPITSDKLNAQVSGSGNVRVTITTTTFNAAISGSGNITAWGTAKHASIGVSGSGGFNGSSFRAEAADVKVSGSGNVSLQADERLNASLSGSGNIRYSGNPEVRQSKSGSGSISKR